MSRKQTMSEKIFSKKAGKTVTAGEFLLLDVDVALANDITAPVAIKEFKKFGGTKVLNKDKIVMVMDHFAPNKDILAAEQVKYVREFAKSKNISKFFDVGRMGIEHVLLPEKGIVKSGDLIVGADSHTCTYGALGAFATGMGSTDLAGVYLTGKAWFRVPESININLTGNFKGETSAKDLILKVISILGVDGANYNALEFSGPGVKNISMDGRFTISNMAIEAGAKAGIFPVDKVTINHEKCLGITSVPLEQDISANFANEISIDLSELKPQVAYPYLPSNCKDIDETEKDRILIDQVVIGSCTNGRMDDLRVASKILKGKKVNNNVRCLVFPGTQKIYQQAMNEGIMDIFIEAECAVSTPTCGPCLGGHMGILADGERAVSTTNRNFTGRMGNKKSEVYLASPAIASFSAINGYISGEFK